MNLARYAWDEPTAREQLARAYWERARREQTELRQSRIDAREIARERKAERRAHLWARLRPAVIGLVLLGCFVAGLWGTSP